MSIPFIPLSILLAKSKVPYLTSTSLFGISLNLLSIEFFVAITSRKIFSASSLFSSCRPFKIPESFIKDFINASFFVFTSFGESPTTSVIS